MSEDYMAPVHRAVMTRSAPEVEDVVARGEDIDTRDRDGRTPLFYAAGDGDAGLVAQLISHGAAVDARDAMGETPLHFAAREYRLEAANLLLRRGAQVDALDRHGNTPLGRAVFASSGRGEMIRLLLAAGADKTLKNKFGSSPESLAKIIATYDVAQFLR